MTAVEESERSMENQRCVETEDGRPCPRYVTEEWACINCGRRVCKQHSEAITFSNFGNDGVACLCYLCMLRLGVASDGVW
jgi:hypothetical protein